MAIRLPRQITPNPDRDLDCQQALEEIFRKVLAMAEQSGWTKIETAAALQELAFTHLAADEENQLTTLAVGQTSHSRH